MQIKCVYILYFLYESVFLLFPSGLIMYGRDRTEIFFCSSLSALLKGNDFLYCNIYNDNLHNSVEKFALKFCSLKIYYIFQFCKQYFSFLLYLENIICKIRMFLITNRQIFFKIFFE